MATNRDRQHRELFDSAWQVGLDAARACTPAPMLVQSHENPLDDSSPVDRSYYVPQGVCGFAWVIVKPGNSSFAQWLKRNELGRRDSYYGGVNIWIGVYGQCYERKVAHASAMAKHLRDNGVRATAMDRLD